MASNYPIFQIKYESHLDRFNLMLLCVSKCTRLCHSYLKTTPDHFYCPDGVFLIKYIFSGKKPPIKRSFNVLSSLQKDNKGTVSTSNDHFMQRAWASLKTNFFGTIWTTKRGPGILSSGNRWISPPPLMSQFYAQ